MRMRRTRMLTYKDFVFPDGSIKMTPEEFQSNENTILDDCSFKRVYGSDSTNLLTGEHTFKISSKIDYWFGFKANSPDHRSHDNMTCCVCESMDREAYYNIKFINIFPKYLHPRDIIFLLIVKTQVGMFWPTLFLYLFLPLWIPLYYVILWYMVKNPWKVRPKLFFDRLKRGEYGGKLIDTIVIKELNFRGVEEPIWYHEMYIKGKKTYQLNKTWDVSTENLFAHRYGRKKLHWIEKLLYPSINKKLQNKYNTVYWFKAISDIRYPHDEHPLRNKNMITEAYLYGRFRVR